MLSSKNRCEIRCDLAAIDSQESKLSYDRFHLKEYEAEPFGLTSHLSKY